MKNLLIFAALTITLLSCAKQKVETPNGSTTVDTVYENVKAYAQFETNQVVVTTSVTRDIPALSMRCNITYDVYDNSTYLYTKISNQIAVPGGRSDTLANYSSRTNIRNVNVTAAIYSNLSQYCIIVKYN